MHFMRAISVRSAGGKRRDIRRCNKTAGFALPPSLSLSLSLSPSSSGERGAGDYRKGVMRDGGRIPAAPESFRARVSAKAQREASRRDARLLLHPAMPIDARGCCDARRRPRTYIVGRGKGRGLFASAASERASRLGADNEETRCRIARSDSRCSSEAAN